MYLNLKGAIMKPIENLQKSALSILTELKKALKKFHTLRKSKSIV